MRSEYAPPFGKGGCAHRVAPKPSNAPAEKTGARPRSITATTSERIELLLGIGAILDKFSFV
jgi:hypothetical protein